MSEKKSLVDHWVTWFVETAAPLVRRSLVVLLMVIMIVIIHTNNTEHKSHDINNEYNCYNDASDNNIETNDKVAPHRVRKTATSLARTESLVVHHDDPGLRAHVLQPLSNRL